MTEARETRSTQISFDATPEIFATDSAGAFAFPMSVAAEKAL